MAGHSADSNDPSVERHGEVAKAYPFPASLVLSPTSRWPTTLPEDTIRLVLDKPLPAPVPASAARLSENASVTIVIVTFNNLVYTRMCIESLLANTAHPGYEIIVIDNASADETPAYLQELSRRFPQIRPIFNDSNAGFARANNQGLAQAEGERLVLLNNDTLVLDGWLPRLLRHLNDSAVGLVGPVSNRTGNEAQIEAPYRTYGELQRFAADYVHAHEGELFDIRMLAMFCVAMRREVHAKVGPLDERFQLGLFEDDDYAMRVRAAGYRVICAEDAFVHHFGQASIGKLAARGEYGKLFHENRRRWEEKWGAAWRPYSYRPNPHYDQLVERIREAVLTHVPPGATVLVASKGDEELIRLEGRKGWHFPRDAGGTYAGYSPADSALAISHLEEQRRLGGDFFLVPSTSLWWLDYYPEFRRHLEGCYRQVLDQKDVCLIFALSEPAVASSCS